MSTERGDTLSYVGDFRNPFSFGKEGQLNRLQCGVKAKANQDMDGVRRGFRTFEHIDGKKSHRQKMRINSNFPMV